MINIMIHGRLTIKIFDASNTVDFWLCGGLPHGSWWLKSDQEMTILQRKKVMTFSKPRAFISITAIKPLGATAIL